MKVRLLYHSKAGDPQTTENQTSLESPVLPPGVEIVPRTTTAIMHDKFVILSRIDADRRQPEAVLCGSTNFTENGVYRQANVVHVARNGGIATEYLRQFELLLKTAGNPSATKKAVTNGNRIDPACPFLVGFTPRTGKADLAEFVRIVNLAQRDVLFCTVFGLDAGLQTALVGQPHDRILRFGLQNSRTTITGFHKDRTARFVATAFLNTGLEGWLKESTAGQKGNILVHTKLVVVDFTSDAPTVISGSHNLSGAASTSNDENFMVIRGDADIADAYGVELMRLYDHYRFRWVAKQEKSGAPALALTDEWTGDYFGGDALKTADRTCFC